MRREKPGSHVLAEAGAISGNITHRSLCPQGEALKSGCIIKIFG
jgi:hypothetical protein